MTTERAEVRPQGTAVRRSVAWRRACGRLLLAAAQEAS
ncbi:hypothetical protein ES332_D13G167000v1 [Gossypium tomentosum]|uniref:Uncharacterized protein n=1 Tax=Gossypium tomentosum TaxID=34277 RepID=A0A5D2HYJ6_GOSTO|nr:hypothetical protein ES332_D13G167000v1 [Gossypium tomentosum]